MRSVEGLRKQARPPRVDLLGKSVQGREIPCIQFFDPEVPEELKQRALIIAGQHGSEESGRAIALALMQFLASGEPEAVDLLRQQTIAVVPCANPDGAMANTYHNADDVNTAHDFPFDAEPVSPESRALNAFALAFEPEMHVDIHGLAGGSMNDRVWLEQVPGFSANATFATLMALEATGLAEELGYPVCEVRPPLPLDPRKSATGRLGEKLSFEMNTLGFGLEAIERYYGEKEWCEAGLVRLRALLRYGCGDRFKLGFEGYPNALVSGHRLCGLCVHGETAALRRQNRRELTRFLCENFALVSRGADGPDGMARVAVHSKTVLGKNPERFSISLRFKKPCMVEFISWDGARLEAAPGHGYRINESAQTLQLIVDLRAPLPIALVETSVGSEKG